MSIFNNQISFISSLELSKNNGVVLKDDREKWHLSLQKFLNAPVEPVQIVVLHKKFTSASCPVLARGIDKCTYVVKGHQAGRQIISDQIVAQLGVVMGAPVGRPEIVEISSELIVDPEFSFLAPGKAHGTHWIPNCSDERGAILYKDHSGNRERFALLSVLFGWVQSQDDQFICDIKHPRLVYSVDHGQFFPGRCYWTIDSLRNANSPQVDNKLIVSCELTKFDIEKALSFLENVNEESIIQAVASPPDEWGITIEERMTMIEYLITRRQTLLESF